MSAACDPDEVRPTADRGKSVSLSVFRVKEFERFSAIVLQFGRQECRRCAKIAPTAYFVYAEE